MTTETSETTGRRERSASPYRQWQDTQGIPIYTGSYVQDLYSIEVKPWALVGQKGAFVNLADQETSDGWVIEIAPAGSTEVMHHLCEATMFVLEGRGATTFWQEGSPKESVEWQRGSIIAPPLNCYYQHFNGDGQAPVRLLVVTSAPVVLNQFRHPEFLFNDKFVFDQRFDAGGSYFSAPAERIGPFRWRTNFVPDIRTHAVEPKPHRGQDNVGINFTMSNNSMAVAASEFPPGSYKMAHRHSVGAYVFILSGQGFSLLRWEGEEEARRVDWKDGTILSPKAGEFHQHFNTGNGPARYLKIRPGALAAEHWNGRGPEQIDYADEDPRIYEAYSAECERNGMQAFPHPGKAKVRS